MFKSSSPQTESFIIDAEVVAVDPATGALKTFQELSNRARKDVRLDEVKVSVCVFAFDIMFLDGQVSHRRLAAYVILSYSLGRRQILLERPFRERRNLLRTRFPPYTPAQLGAARFDHVKSVESEEGREVVEEFWQTAVNSSSEGLMVKVRGKFSSIPALAADGRMSARSFSIAVRFWKNLTRRKTNHVASPYLPHTSQVSPTRADELRHAAP